RSRPNTARRARETYATRRPIPRSRCEIWATHPGSASKRACRRPWSGTGRTGLRNRNSGFVLSASWPTDAGVVRYATALRGQVSAWRRPTLRLALPVFIAFRGPKALNDRPEGPPYPHCYPERNDDSDAIRLRRTGTIAT